MDKAHLVWEEQKIKQSEMKWNEKSKNLALLGLAVPVEYLSNQWS